MGGLFFLNFFDCTEMYAQISTGDIDGRQSALLRNMKFPLKIPHNL